MPKTKSDQMGYIEVEKIIEKEIEKKDRQGMQVFIPGVFNPDGSPKKVTEKSVSSYKELIRLEHIRSAQPWNNRSTEVKHKFSGPLTMLFMIGDDRMPEDDKKPRKKPSILINESYDSFAERIGAKRLIVNAVREEAQ